MIRVFVAIELDQALRAALARLLQDTKMELGRALLKGASQPRVQWVRPDAMHVTLKFLGDVEEGRLEAIQQALAAVAQRTHGFVVPVQGLGVFPDVRAPRVLWVGLREPATGPTLGQCAIAIDDVLGDLDFERERRPFSAHLTLARIKEGGREIGRALGETGLLAAAMPVGTLAVGALALMRSELRPSGSIYTRLVNAPLRTT